MRRSASCGVALIALIVLLGGAPVLQPSEAQAESWWKGVNKTGRLAQCTTKIGYFWYCRTPDEACKSNISQSWEPLQDYKLTPVYDGNNMLTQYDCYFDPKAFILPVNTPVYRLCTAPGGCANETPEKALGDSEDGCSAAEDKVGNPIDVSTGNKYMEVEDFATAGPDVLAFRRYYNSMELKIGRFFDHKWRSNFDRALIINAAVTKIDLQRPNGQTFKFEKSGSEWVTSAGNDDVDFGLSDAAPGYEVTTPNQTVETYDAGGRLTAITAPNGYQQTLTYNGSDQPTAVTDSHGRTLTFAFHPGRDLLWKMTGPDGHEVNYYYHIDPARLRYVIAADDTPSTFADNPRVEYHYEDAGFPLYLTGITDWSTGNRFATYTYDDQGRAISSEHAGGAGKVTVTYNGDGTTTVRNALNKDTTYIFATVQGVQKITRIDGVASTNCPADNTDFAYDTNGYVNSVTDREGHLTTYVKDGRGLPTSVTEASGTPLARTTTTTWHATYRKPTQIVAPGLTTDFTYDADGNMLTRTETDTTTHSVPYSTNGQTRVWTFTYTTAGQLATADGPLSGTADTTTYAYDTAGYLTQVTDALGHVTDITAVNGRGQPTSITDANGVVTDLEYDPRGMLTKRTVDGTSVTHFDYDSVGQLVRMVLPDGSALNYAYDGAHRLTGVSNDSGESIAYTLDAKGNVTVEEVKDPAGTVKKSLTRTFDELGRMLTSVGAASQTTSFAYNKNDLTDDGHGPAVQRHHKCLRRAQSSGDGDQRAQRRGGFGLQCLRRPGQCQRPAGAGHDLCA